MQHANRAQHTRAAQQKRQAELMANPSPDLVAAYEELRATEIGSGARLGCAFVGDMSDPHTVRTLTRLLSDRTDKSR